MPAVNYSASPTCARFMKSAAFGRLVAGPVGSGKTTSCIMELFRRSLEQEKAPDGYRYTRFAVVRQTLKQLKDTVLKDIMKELEGLCTYRVTDNLILVEFGDIRSEWLLIPLEDPEDQRRLLSMQLTGAWMSECIEMQVKLVAALSGRCGRYPSGNKGYCTWRGVIADTNMPSEGSDWHKFMTDPNNTEWEIFLQPGGLEEHAENLMWLNQTAESVKLPLDSPERAAIGRVYYERLARTSNVDWVKRYVHAQFGDDPSGSAVYRDSFKSSFHVVEGLQPHKFAPLIIGQDFGRDPCSVITQMDPRGRFCILEEVIAEDIGLEAHIEKNLRPILMGSRYFGIPVIVIGDPAGNAKSSIYEETTFDVMRRMGFKCMPAPTNDLDPRLRAIESWLLKQSDGKGAMLLDKDRCPVTIRGLAGGYRYARTRTGVKKPLPDKNEYSHPLDALQYAALVTHGQMNEVVGRFLHGRPQRAPRPKVKAAGWT